MTDGQGSQQAPCPPGVPINVTIDPSRDFNDGHYDPGRARGRTLKVREPHKIENRFPQGKHVFLIAVMLQTGKNTQNMSGMWKLWIP